ncbi:MAG TPA: hypothetical protein VEQ11_19140 [Chloroflexota bacterium]|nr:hypothetical protein [Chloroflexota bacterium]
MITGEGFTPAVLSGKALASVLPTEPVQELVTPVLTVLRYEPGYQVLVQEERVEVSRSRPPSGTDELMQDVARALLQLWPLVEPKAVGINFVLGQVYSQQLSKDRVFKRLMRKERVDLVFGASVSDSEHSFKFEEDSATVTAKMVTGAQIAGREALLLSINAHYEPVEELASVLESQTRWHDRAVRWSERLMHGK